MNHSWKIPVLLFMIMAFVSACASKQPAVGKSLILKGYSEIWLDKKVVQVDFKGGSEENVDKLKHLAVLRAADIGKERNFERFIIVSSTDQVIIDGVRKTGDQYIPVEKLKASVVVRFLSPNDAGYAQAFSVNEKTTEIKKKYSIK